jgi:membrane-associated PAP2 superfamily phosphatase
MSCPSSNPHRGRKHHRTRHARFGTSLIRSHFWLPLLVFAAALAVLEIAGLDPAIARAWYFDDGATRWIGSGPGAWWARDLLHTGGRWLIRGIAAAALFAWALSFVSTRARPWRRRAGFIVLAIVVATALVGALKAVTNVDCPWDLAGFGGRNPYVPLFADRPDSLPHAACFPGAHASSGFALMCFYFVLRDPMPRLARVSLGIAIAIGLAFSIGQEARGAHFLSHDLASAALVWFIQLALYGWLLRPSSATQPLAAVAASAPSARDPWRSTARPPEAT